MATVQIPEELDSALQSAAARSGQTRDELAQEILSIHLGDRDAYSITDRQLSRLGEGIEQVRRGETVSGEVVISKLDSLMRDLETRERKAS